MTNKLPPEVSHYKSLTIMLDHAENFQREIVASETSSSIPSNLETDQLNTTTDINASDDNTAKPQEQKLEDCEDAAGVNSSQDGGEVQENVGSSTSSGGSAMPPQSSKHGSSSLNSSRPRKGGEDEDVDRFAPGVYVTFTVLPSGTKIFKRIRFRYICYFLSEKLYSILNFSICVYAKTLYVLDIRPSYLI